MFAVPLDRGGSFFCHSRHPLQVLNVAPDYVYARRSLKLPITLGVVLIVLLVLLLVGWVLLSVFGVFNSQHGYLYWTLLSVGAVLFVRCSGRRCFLLGPLGQGDQPEPTPVQFHGQCLARTQVTDRVVETLFADALQTRRRSTAARAIHRAYAGGRAATR